MQEHILFLNMFSQYQPPEDICDVLSQAAVVAADIDPQRRRVEVCVHNEQYLPQRILKTVGEDIAAAYGLHQVEILATHPAHQLQCIEPQELQALFVAQNSMNRGSLAGARWEWEGSTLHIHLAGNGTKLLEEAIPAVKQQLQQRFDTAVAFSIHVGKNLEGQALFDEMEKIRVQAAGTIPSGSAAQTAAKPQAAQPAESIYGKPFKGAAVSMKELDLNMGGVIVEGKVFAVEHKELKKRNAWVINFDMTDNTGAVRINRFMESNEAKPILDSVKVGSILRVQGKPTVNNFDNEMVLKPFAIMPGAMEKRKDTAQGEKRVELHLHTSMSNMDALTSTKDAIKQAAAWGHKAIAITDHGCCQSFTDALHVVEAWGGGP